MNNGTKRLYAITSAIKARGSGFFFWLFFLTRVLNYYCRHQGVTLCAAVTIDIDTLSLFLQFAGFIITKGIIEFLPAEFPYTTFYFRDDKSLCSGSFNLQTDRCAVCER